MKFLKNKQLITNLIVLILLTVLTLGVYQLMKPEDKEIDTTETINIRVIISLDNGKDVISDKELEVPLNSTIYDVLINHFDIKATEYSYGIFVTSINGYEQNDNKYWFFSVNGEYIAVGADAYYLKDNDIVVWDLHEWKEDKETDTTETINIRVIISLDNGKDVISDKELEVPLNSTIYDVLRNHFDIKVTEYSFGVLITSINGYDQNNNKYWFFNVNGEDLMVGVDAYYLKDNDIVVGDLHEWKE